MPKTSSDLTPEEWNEPVFCCRSCKSLFILRDESLAGNDWDGTYCGKCGSTDVHPVKFGEWLRDREREERKRLEREWNK